MTDSISPQDAAPASPEPEDLSAGEQDQAAPDYPQEVRILELDGRKIVLVGTAHVSRSSVELVHRVIETETPDCVCVELDPQRAESLNKKTKWEELDLKQLIRKKQLTTLLVNLLLASYQKKLGNELGVQPGTELLEATVVAEEMDIPVTLCDRDVRITLRRAAHATPFFSRMMLMSELFLTMFDGPDVTEEQLQELREQDVLTELMEGLGKRYPTLKRVLIDERDAYLAQKIHDSPGDHLVAVVGAGHLRGIETALREHREADLEALEVIPPVSPFWKVVGWSIPVLILGAIFYIGWSQGMSEARDSALVWILANSIPAAFGAIIALAHPLTIITAFVAAPIASLSPVIGTAYLTAFVQTWVAPPKVKEFKSVSEDIGKPIMWWKNRLLKIFLAYLLPGIGSMIGTFVGGGKILSDLFG